MLSLARLDARHNRISSERGQSVEMARVLAKRGYPGGLFDRSARNDRRSRDRSQDANEVAFASDYARDDDPKRFDLLITGGWVRSDQRRCQSRRGLKKTAAISNGHLYKAPVVRDEHGY